MNLQVLGIDEVGRGSWAGPLVVAAVVLRKSIAGLTDSKILNSKSRELLASQIKKNSTYGLGWVSPAEVDRFGLTSAICVAMRLALAQIGEPYNEIIIDGNYNFLSPDGYGQSKINTMIKADLYVPSVSAASILAKVARDKYMAEQSVIFPAYGFERHVGYGTLLHRQAIQKHGICELHRLSFKPIKEMLL